MSRKVIYGTKKGIKKYILENGYLYAIIKQLKYAPWLYRARLYSHEDVIVFGYMDAEAQRAVENLKEELHIPEQTK